MAQSQLAALAGAARVQRARVRDQAGVLGAARERRDLHLAQGERAHRHRVAGAAGGAHTQAARDAAAPRVHLAVFRAQRDVPPARGELPDLLAVERGRHLVDEGGHAHDEGRALVLLVAGARHGRHPVEAAPREDRIARRRPGRRRLAEAEGSGRRRVGARAARGRGAGAGAGAGAAAAALTAAVAPLRGAEGAPRTLPRRDDPLGELGAQLQRDLHTALLRAVGRDVLEAKLQQDGRDELPVAVLHLLLVDRVPRALRGVVAVLGSPLLLGLGRLARDGREPARDRVVDRLPLALVRARLVAHAHVAQHVPLLREHALQRARDGRAVAAVAVGVALAALGLLGGAQLRDELAHALGVVLDAVELVQLGEVGAASLELGVVVVERHLAVGLELGRHLGRARLALREQHVDVGVRERRAVALEHGVGAELDHRHELVALCARHLHREAALLDDHPVEEELALGALDDLLLDGALHAETIDVHRPRLPDTVRAVLRLQVLLRVPVRVVQDDRVRREEVDA